MAKKRLSLLEMEAKRENAKLKDEQAREKSKLEQTYFLQKNKYYEGGKVVLWLDYWTPEKGIIIQFKDPKTVKIKTRKNEVVHRSLDHLDYAEQSIRGYLNNGRIKDGKLQVRIN